MDVIVSLNLSTFFSDAFLFMIDHAVILLSVCMILTFKVNNFLTKQPTFLKSYIAILAKKLGLYPANTKQMYTIYTASSQRRFITPIGMKSIDPRTERVGYL